MMPFGMAHGAGGFQHHTAGGGGALQRSASQQHSRHLRHLTTAAAAATAGLAGAHLHRTGRLAPLLPLAPQKQRKAGQAPLLQIPRELAEVICGAFGEIVQVAVLYPLDTIKVGWLGANTLHKSFCAAAAAACLVVGAGACAVSLCAQLSCSSKCARHQHLSLAYSGTAGPCAYLLCV